MVLSILFNSLLHETRQGRQNVDGRVDLFIVKLPVNENLTLSDIASQVRDGMGDIVVLHQTNSTGIDRIGI